LNKTNKKLHFDGNSDFRLPVTSIYCFTTTGYKKVEWQLLQVWFSACLNNVRTTVTILNTASELLA